MRCDPSDLKTLKRVTATASPNIAVVKYWGKKDVERNIPINSSLSITLDQSRLYTETSVSRSGSNEHKVTINGTQLTTVPARIQKMINVARNESSNGEDLYFDIVSRNNFPTACGLASSASGMAALAEAICPFYGITDKEKVSMVARIGSGSACRSLFGGFVLWPCEEPSIPMQLFPDDYWNELCVLIVVFNSQGKKVPSTEGMGRTLATSELLSVRSQVVDGRLDRMTEAIASHNFADFAEITMRESNQLHALCLDTFPPIIYLNQHSYELIKFTLALNATYRKLDVQKTHGSTQCLAYSFDAGPNGFLFTLRKNLSLVLGLFLTAAKKLNEKSIIDDIELVLDGGGTDPVLEEKVLSDNAEISDTLEKVISNAEKLIFSKVGSAPKVSYY